LRSDIISGGYALASAERRWATMVRFGTIPVLNCRERGTALKHRGVTKKRHWRVVSMGTWQK